MPRFSHSLRRLQLRLDDRGLLIVRRGKQVRIGGEGIRKRWREREGLVRWGRTRLPLANEDEASEGAARRRRVDRTQSRGAREPSEASAVRRLRCGRSGQSMRLSCSLPERRRKGREIRDSVRTATPPGAVRNHF
jgi:hypothetical protein